MARRLGKTWSRAVLTGEGWPYRVALGGLSRADLLDRYAEEAGTAQALRLAARDWGCTVEERSRSVARMRLSLPTHLVVPDLDTAARVAGGPWPGRVAAGRQRAGVLGLTGSAGEKDLAASAKVVAATDGWSDVDVELLRDTAAWFVEHGRAEGLTPRQVPVPGLHAKWLDGRAWVVALLAGLDDLGLVGRPPSIGLTYLDPQHLASGGRRFDAVTPGDAFVPAYPVRVAVVCENKDTRLFLHPCPGAVAVDGYGNAVTRLGRLPWVVEAETIVYWGDIDATGYLLLSRAREALGRPVRSLLMDEATRRAYERFGTSTDADGRPIRRVPVTRPVSLEPHEQEVYDLLTDPDFAGFVRYEQERIPLDAAARALAQLLAGETGRS